MPEWTDQLTPVPAGSGSVNVKPVTSTVPVLSSVTVNPAWPPTLTVAASAVFVIVTQRTVVEAWAEPEPPLVVVKLAVLW